MSVRNIQAVPLVSDIRPLGISSSTCKGHSHVLSKGLRKQKAFNSRLVEKQAGEHLRLGTCALSAENAYYRRAESKDLL
jgi:hypothetical protein